MSDTKTVLITGSTSGMGLGIAEALAGFLYSDDAMSSTGAALPVDGDWTAH